MVPRVSIYLRIPYRGGTTTGVSNDQSRGVTTVQKLGDQDADIRNAEDVDEAENAEGVHFRADYGCSGAISSRTSWNSFITVYVRYSRLYNNNGKNWPVYNPV